MYNASRRQAEQQLYASDASSLSSSSAESTNAKKKIPRYTMDSSSRAMVQSNHFGKTKYLEEKSSYSHSENTHETGFYHQKRSANNHAKHGHDFGYYHKKKSSHGSKPILERERDIIYPTINYGYDEENNKIKMKRSQNYSDDKKEQTLPSISKQIKSVMKHLKDAEGMIHF